MTGDLLASAADRSDTVAMRRAFVLVVAAAFAGCGSSTARPTATGAHVAAFLARNVQSCRAGQQVRLGTARLAYAAIASHGAVAYRLPRGSVLARFDAKNVNDYPTVFGVRAAVVAGGCAPQWYRVQLPLKPNGLIGYVRARDVTVQTVSTRIVVDISERRLTLFRRGRLLLRATVAVGSVATPTPTGSFYVNQRLVPTDRNGPFGPGAVGISAYSNVLTGWTQGGPIAIHGTNEPWSIGRAVSNGCIRLPNATLRRVFAAALAGTPVLVRA